MSHQKGIHISPVPIEEVLNMRQAVMYPEENLDFVKLEEDDHGKHWGLYYNEEVLSVISVFEQSDGSVQFRKFATRTDIQGQGYGTQLLQFVMDWAAAHNKKNIWCNARQSATALYKRFGMHPVGEPWVRYGIAFIKMEKQF